MSDSLLGISASFHPAKTPQRFFFSGLSFLWYDLHNIKLSHFRVRFRGFKYICIVVHPKGLMGGLIETGDGENRGGNSF